MFAHVHAMMFVVQWQIVIRVDQGQFGKYQIPRLEKDLHLGGQMINKYMHCMRQANAYYSMYFLLCNQNAKWDVEYTKYSLLMKNVMK